MKKLFLVFLSVFLVSACGAGAPANHPNGGHEIIAFGDSITSGVGVNLTQAYPALLEDKTQRPVINLGVSGNTMRQGADRKEQLARHDPYMVLILFGGNDAIRGRPMSQTEASLIEIIDYVQSLGAIAVVVDTGGNFKMTPYTKMQKKIAKEKNAVFVPAIYKGIFTDKDYKADAIHPNAKGHRVIADRIYKVIKNYL